MQGDGIGAEAAALALCVKVLLCHVLYGMREGWSVVLHLACTERNC